MKSAGSIVFSYYKNKRKENLYGVWVRGGEKLGKFFF